MSNKYYAVYQAGHAVYGVGKTPAEAIEDAREWVDNGETLESELVERSRANDGDMVVEECSEALFNEVQESGGDIVFSEHEDIIRLDSEIA